MALAVVTGANRGIGLAFSRALVARGDRVIAACRVSSHELDSLGVRVEAGVDVTDDSAIEALARRLGDLRIDLLVNNAGALTRDGLGRLDFAAIGRLIEVNAVGALRITSALLPCLGSGSKIAFITSLMGSMGDNGSGGSYAYRMSKAALNAAGVSLARDLASRRIAVVLLHPGFVRTDMTRQQGTVDPDESVRGMLARIDELTVETSGRLVRWSGEPLPW